MSYVRYQEICISLCVSFCIKLDRSWPSQSFSGEAVANEQLAMKTRIELLQNKLDFENIQDFTFEVAKHKIYFAFSVCCHGDQRALVATTSTRGRRLALHRF